MRVDIFRVVRAGRHWNHKYGSPAAATYVYVLIGEDSMYRRYIIAEQVWG